MRRTIFCVSFAACAVLLVWGAAGKILDQQQ